MTDPHDRPFGAQPDQVLRLAAHAADAADALAEAAERLAHAAPGVGVFGGAAQGRLGEYGRRLHAFLSETLARQAADVSEHGARYADLAADLRTVLASYDDADRAAHQQFRSDDPDGRWLS